MKIILSDVKSILNISSYYEGVSSTEVDDYNLKRAAVSFIILIGTSISVIMLILGLFHTLDVYAPYNQNNFKWNHVPTFISAVIVAPILEEIEFRLILRYSTFRFFLFFSIWVFFLITQFSIIGSKIITDLFDYILCVITLTFMIYFFIIHLKILEETIKRFFFPINI